MARGFIAKHAKTVGDLAFDLQFNAETLWPLD